MKRSGFQTERACVMGEQLWLATDAASSCEKVKASVYHDVINTPSSAEEKKLEKGSMGKQVITEMDWVLDSGYYYYYYYVSLCLWSWAGYEAATNIHNLTPKCPSVILSLS